MKNKLIENIKNTRKDKGLSQESVAYDLGIDYSTYGKIERGKIGLSVERLDQIARILNVTVQDLYEWNSVIGTSLDDQNGKLKDCQIELEQAKNELQHLKNQLKESSATSSTINK